MTYKLIFVFYLTICGSIIVAQNHSISNYKIPIHELEVNEDSVVAKSIEELVINDSVQILAYEKFLMDDNSVNEKCGFIDYSGFTQRKLSMAYYDKQLQSVISRERFESINKANEGSTGVKNPYSKLNDTYILVKKINDNYILYDDEIEYRAIISDTSIFLTAWMGGIVMNSK